MAGGTKALAWKRNRIAKDNNTFMPGLLTGIQEKTSRKRSFECKAKSCCPELNYYAASLGVMQKYQGSFDSQRK
jgi:hypothetical protein